jgi:hypothetical protein
MDRYIEHVRENGGTRYLDFPVNMTPEQMQEYARQMLATDVVQVTFSDRGAETVFERDA